VWRRKATVLSLQDGRSAILCRFDRISLAAHYTEIAVQLSADTHAHISLSMRNSVSRLPLGMKNAWGGLALRQLCWQLRYDDFRRHYPPVSHKK